MKITILTLFPEMFQGPFDVSIVNRAQKKKLVDIEYINIRDFGIGKHKLVDDTPYGGGNGMVLRVDVLHKAIEKAKGKKLKGNAQKVILLGAKGKTFNQRAAERFSKLEHLIIVCGHYEGFDERIKNYVNEEISIGDFILTGGEIPAMLITDSVIRLIKGVIRDSSAALESFSPYLEHPQYTKPQKYQDLSVPETLLSGDHKRIDAWRRKESVNITSKLRPDLIK